MNDLGRGSGLERREAKTSQLILSILRMPSFLGVESENVMALWSEEKESFLVQSVRKGSKDGEQRVMSIVDDWSPLAQVGRKSLLATTKEWVSIISSKIRPLGLLSS